MSGWVPSERERAEALEWAQQRVSADHHFRCGSRKGSACDCYFTRPDYLAARILIANAERVVALTEALTLIAHGLHDEQHGVEVCADVARAALTGSAADAAEQAE